MRRVLSGKRREAELTRLRRIVGQIPDPEVPVLTLDDLGIIRGLEFEDDGGTHVILTPTYSGCPAIDAIRDDVVRVLHESGVGKVDVSLVLAPPWSTDWMSDEGRRKLEHFGIAPPGRCAAQTPPLLSLSVCCPTCRSFDTRLVSRFGSTACKAHYVCESCREPFDHFKAI